MPARIVWDERCGVTEYVKSNFISDARLNANRQNSQISSGPKTPEGKLVSSKRCQTNLTGCTVPLATDTDRYQFHIQSFKEEVEPEGQRETFLTQSIAAAWRLERISGFEMASYAKDRALFANNSVDEPEFIRPHLIEPRHLPVQREATAQSGPPGIPHPPPARRDTQELRHLQAERKRLIQEKLQLAAQANQKPKLTAFRSIEHDWVRLLNS